MPFDDKNRIREKNINDKYIKRLIKTLIIIFLFLITSVLYIDKKSGDEILLYINRTQNSIDRYIEKNQEEMELKEKLNNSIENNKILLEEEIKKHKFIALSILIASAIVLAILIYYITKGMRDNQREIKNMVFRDDITNGDSAISFRMKIKEAIKNNPPGTYTIALLNIINFKLINSSFGFYEGDKTLKYIHDKIKENLKEEEFLCRSDIDNFFMCIKEYDEDSIKQRLEKIGKSINDFNENKELKHYLQAAYGYIIVEDINMDVRVMMNYARFSCSDYKKTREFKNYSNLVSKVARESKLNSMFEDSLANRDFYVYLQPKININNEKCVGAEALVRWIHPREGFISPGEFIELFEHNDKIIELDLYVFEEVCKIIKNWMDEDKKLIPISVNLSRRHLKNQDFLKNFIEIKNNYHIPNGMIEFEILESVVLDNDKINMLSAIMNQIHRNGFLCSLDDFGFGYSSLVFLNKLDVDTIKLDRRFFLDLNNEKSQKVIEGFIKICENLNIKVVAEGIETEEQINYLKKVNCELVQGFIFSKAIDVSTFEKDFLEKGGE